MHKSDVLSRRRDSALVRLRRTNRGIGAASTALLLAFAAVAARGFSGHSSAAAATTVRTSPTPSAAGRDAYRTSPRPLARAKTAPKHAAKRRHASHRALTSTTTTASQPISPLASPVPAPVVTNSGGS